MKRRLAAILVADVVGYSRLMELDEDGTADRVAAVLDLAGTEVDRCDGRLFKSMGDALFAEFESPMNALRCAIAIRECIALSEKSRESPLRLRFGLHVGDVLTTGDDLVGDVINLATRIQQAADPDAIDLSAAMFEQIRRTSPYAFDDCGERDLKNIGEPVRIYRLRGEIRRHPYQITPTRDTPSRAKAPYSLAVMPLETHSRLRDQEFLADGLAEELIFELGRFKKLFVTSRSATLSIQPDDMDPKAVGERLGVRYVLTGSVRQLGERTHLGLSLIETDTGTIVWSDRLRSSFDELVEGFDDLVSRIASTILGRIEASDIAASRRLKPESMTAYEAYLRGLEFHRLGGVTDENKRRAMGWFRRAIDSDPDFARPYAMLTCAWSGLPDFDLDAGIRSVERALELDPNDPEAYRIMGSIKLGAGEFDAARHYHEKAMSLSPSDAYIKGRTASFYNFVGEPDRALSLLDEADALDPFLPVWCVEERVVALYGLGRFEEAVRIARALPFQTRRSRLYAAASCVAMDEMARARRLVAEALASAEELSASFIEHSEYYMDPETKRLLIGRLVEAGLPERSDLASTS